MSQTQRTLAALTTLLATNTDGNIGAEDIRDMLVSLVPSRGGMFIAPADAVETTITTIDTWTALAGTWTEDGVDIPMLDWSMPSNGAFRYDGVTEQSVLIAGKVSLVPGGADTEYSVTVALDGTPDERFVSSHAFTGPRSGDAATTVPLAATLSVEPGQTITLWVRNDNGTENATAQRATVNVVGFIT